MTQAHAFDMLPIPAGNRIREARESLGLSADEVATQLGIPVADVTEIEDRGGYLSPSAMRTLSRLCLRPPGYLTGPDGTAPRPEAAPPPPHRPTAPTARLPSAA